MQKTGKARLALTVIGDALDRMFNGYYTGTPQEHVDRLNELFSRRPKSQPIDALSIEYLPEADLGWGGVPRSGKGAPALTDAQDRKSDLIAEYLDDDTLFYADWSRARGDQIRPVKADASARNSILLAASGLTSAPSDADAVLANAEPLLAWVESADDQDDLHIRVLALIKQWGINDLADDDPVRFLAEAGKLYEFMTAGQEA